MSLIEDIKYEEGFRGYEYLDSVGKPTIGYGTLLPLSREEAELLLEYRLNRFISSVKAVTFNLDIKDEAREILYHMAYQLGLPGLLKFKKMFAALKNKDYLEASRQMKDSLWYKQTPNRAKRLIGRMADLA